MKTVATTKESPRLAALFEQLDPVRARVIFAIDATASRQPTWDIAARLTTQMFKTAASAGGVDLQLVYFRAEETCTSRWMSDAGALSSTMASIMCRSGLTQIGKVLSHVRAEDQRQKIAAVIFVGDACEEVLRLISTRPRASSIRCRCSCFRKARTGKSPPSIASSR